MVRELAVEEAGGVTVVVPSALMHINLFTVVSVDDNPSYSAVSQLGLRKEFQLINWSTVMP
jgi:hypothetical protein